MIPRDSRFKWYKNRNLLAAALLSNILLANYYFFDVSVSTLSYSGHSLLDNEVDGFKTGITPPHSPASNAPNLPPTSKASKPPEPPIRMVATTTEPKPPVLPPLPAQAVFNLNNIDFNGEYVGWPLERVCNETKFQPGLLYICDNNSGGIGNIRNFILTCIRYAIDSGATGVILPQIQKRGGEDLSDIFSATLHPFHYFFDEEHFRFALGAHCPRLAVFDSIENIPNWQNRSQIKEFYPKDLNNNNEGDRRGRNNHLDMFRSNFDLWLKETRRTPSEGKPVTIRFKWATFFEWPIYRDGPEFANTFGDILRIRKDIAALAASTLVEMSRFAGVDSPAEKVLTLKAPFLGVHLRSESDAPELWPDFDTQSNGYLKTAESFNLKYAYIACGSIIEIDKFREKGWSKLQLKVASKLDLLKGDDLKRLEALSWDQQALVDFLVLTKSTHFSGCSFSSFSMNIALKRHLMSGGLSTRPWKAPGDAYSTVVGRFESWWSDWIYMWECMWP